MSEELALLIAIGVLLGVLLITAIGRLSKIAKKLTAIHSTMLRMEVSQSEGQVEMSVAAANIITALRGKKDGNQS